MTCSSLSSWAEHGPSDSETRLLHTSGVPSRVAALKRRVEESHEPGIEYSQIPQ